MSLTVWTTLTISKQLETINNNKKKITTARITVKCFTLSTMLYDKNTLSFFTSGHNKDYM